MRRVENWMVVIGVVIVCEQEHLGMPGPVSVSWGSIVFDCIRTYIVLYSGP